MIFDGNVPHHGAAMADWPISRGKRVKLTAVNFALFAFINSSLYDFWRLALRLLKHCVIARRSSTKSTAKLHLSRILL
jgi:hypothetical protein